MMELNSCIITEFKFENRRRKLTVISDISPKKWPSLNVTNLTIFGSSVPLDDSSLEELFLNQFLSSTTSQAPSRIINNSSPTSPCLMMYSPSLNSLMSDCDIIRTLSIRDTLCINGTPWTTTEVRIQ